MLQWVIRSHQFPSRAPDVFLVLVQQWVIRCHRGEVIRSHQPSCAPEEVCRFLVLAVRPPGLEHQSYFRSHLLPSCSLTQGLVIMILPSRASKNKFLDTVLTCIRQALPCYSLPLVPTLHNFHLCSLGHWDAGSSTERSLPQSLLPDSS